jgi:choline dehydrogenase-like flavoprotein
VEVDESVRDAWGIPVAKLTGARHAEDFKTGKFIAGKAVEWLRAAGAIETWETLPGKGTNGGQHQAGTCRMGNDPKTSVVNKYGQMHNVDNVFVVDGSVNVTNGGFNPSLTIQAIAFWSSVHIVKEWKGTRFRG